MLRQPRHNFENGLLGKVSEMLKTIDDEVNLIEEGILSSLDVLEFILFLESIGGKTGRLKAGVFKNINTIFITFFTQKSHA